MSAYLSRFVSTAWVSHLSFLCFFSFTLHSILFRGAVTLWLSTRWRHASTSSPLCPNMNAVFSPYFTIVAQQKCSTAFGYLPFSGYNFTLDSILCCCEGSGSTSERSLVFQNMNDSPFYFLQKIYSNTKTLWCTKIIQAASPLVHNCLITTGSSSLINYFNFIQPNAPAHIQHTPQNSNFQMSERSHLPSCPCYICWTFLHCVLACLKVRLLFSISPFP